MNSCYCGKYSSSLDYVDINTLEIGVWYVFEEGDIPVSPKLKDPPASATILKKDGYELALMFYMADIDYAYARYIRRLT